LSNVSSAFFVSKDYLDDCHLRRVRDVQNSTFLDQLEPAKRSAVSTLVVDHWEVCASNLIAAVSPSILYVSADIPNSVAVLMAISACHLSSVEAIVTFSSAAFDAIKEAMPITRTVICGRLSSAEGVVTC
jgi:hypothetical protein